VTSRCFCITWLLSSSLILAACGSDDNESNGTNTPDAGQDVQQTDAPGDTNTTDVQGKDVAPDTPYEAGPCTDVESVSGSAIDEGGSPFGGADIILCIYFDGGKAQCLSPVETSGSGQFTVSMTGGTACLESASYQIKSFEDLTVTGLYCTVDVTTGGQIATPGSDRLVKAPAGTRDPLGTLGDPHEVTASKNASIKVIPEGLFLFDFAYEDLRILPWDETAWGWPCFVDPSNPPQGMIGFAPEVEVKPNAKDALHVSFINDEGLAPGTVVDLYALGGGSTKKWDGAQVHEGHWEVIGEAVVTPDGSRIETRGGEGLPFGTWVGWKKK
jgi:hypothetical protein